MLKTVIRLLAISCLLGIPGTALAEGFALYEYSARGVALGGATVARTPDPSAIATNPALITRLPGIQIQTGFSAITPSGRMATYEEFDYAGRVVPSTQSTSLKSSTWTVPHFYYTQKLCDKIAFGVGEFSRFGLGFEYPNNWPGRYNAYEVELQTISINPNIAWAVTDELSLAAGLEFMYLNLDLRKKAFTPLNNAFLGSGGIETDANIRNADSMGLGFNLAAHYQFNEQWAAGLTYRSQIRHRAHGQNSLNSELTPGTNPLFATDPRVAAGLKSSTHAAHGTVVLPDSLAGGVSWTPIPDLSVEAGAVWTRWSTFNCLNITTNTRGVTYSPKEWRDVWRFNVGVEWQALDWLALRAGYVYDMSPMTERYEDYLVPTQNRSIYSVGLGFKWQNWTADLAFAHIAAHGRQYESRPYDHVLKSESKATETEIISVSIGYKF